VLNNKKLQSESDLILVDNIKQNNFLVDKSLEVLSERHSGLYISTVNKITGNCFDNLKNDLLNDKLIVLYNAARSYDKSKGSSFSTHFANETKWNCLKNKTKKSNKEISCENETIDSLFEKNKNFYLFKNYDDNFFKNKIIEELDYIDDERAKKIIIMRYFSNDNKNLPWKKISKEVKLSIQGCINVHNKYMYILNRNISKKYKEIKI
jgi:DNA-directed RNA polymerase specialized sigma subunit